MASKRVLLLTNSELGQANVYLAVSHALLTLQEASVDVHFASFAPIEKAVHATSAFAKESKPSARPIIFHKLDGPDMQSSWKRHIESATEATTKGWPLARALAQVRLLLRVTLPWTGPEIVEVYLSVVRLIEELNPDIIAVDPLLAPALTACRHMKDRFRFVILTPNTIKDFAMMVQPNYEPLWRYPGVGTAFEFPVPWLLIPLNAAIIIFIIYVGIYDSYGREISSYMEETTGAKLITLGNLSLNSAHKYTILVANLPEIEFPLRVFPDHIIACGPMVRPARPVEEADPSLSKWLARAPTLYVNLGTHVAMTEALAIELATALRILLDRAKTPEFEHRKMGQLQVLWKLSRQGDFAIDEPGTAVYDLLGQEIEAGTVRIVEWLEAEPAAVLLADTIVCAVHHGGANSFFECINAGVPQVVLPVWMDTFDFANRVEWLRIGAWGDKWGRDKFVGTRLAKNFIRVLLGPQSGEIKERARKLAEIAEENGGGRVFAARTILAKADEPLPPPPPAENLDGEGNDAAETTELLEKKESPE